MFVHCSFKKNCGASFLPSNWNVVWPDWWDCLLPRVNMSANGLAPPPKSKLTFPCPVDPVRSYCLRFSASESTSYACDILMNCCCAFSFLLGTTLSGWYFRASWRYFALICSGVALRSTPVDGSDIVFYCFFFFCWICLLRTYQVLCNNRHQWQQ